MSESVRPRHMPSALLEDLAKLDCSGRDERGGFTRLAWSRELLGAVQWVAGRMQEAGLATEIDAAGNLIGRWEVGEGPAVVIGSHLDTVTSGGRFDGALGVLTGLDVVRRLRAEGFRPSRPIWVVAFMDEEGERFNSVMLGSRAFVGESIPPDEADRVDAQQVSMGEAMLTWGRDFSEVLAAKHIDDVHCYVELHVELGPVLEAEGVDIGVVTGIVGLIGLSVTLHGITNHAGTTPMAGRRDALVGAAKAITALRDDALASTSHMATVGSITTAPGGANAIPGTCTFSIDLRASTNEGLQAARRSVDAILAEVCEAEGLEARVTQTYSLAPVPLNDEIGEVMSQAAEQEGLSRMRMPSGAGHDAMVLASHVPAGMLFVPSVAGVGHAPEEFTADDDVARGAAALTSTIRELAR